MTEPGDVLQICVDRIARALLVGNAPPLPPVVELRDVVLDVMMLAGVRDVDLVERKVVAAFFDQLDTRLAGVANGGEYAEAAHRYRILRAAVEEQIPTLH